MRFSFFIKKKNKRNDFESLGSIYVRLHNGRQIDTSVPSGLYVNPNFWDSKQECVKLSSQCNEKERIRINKELWKLKSFLEEKAREDKDSVDRLWLKNQMAAYSDPVIAKEGSPTLDELCAMFLKFHDVSEARKRHFRVVYRTFKRFECFVGILNNKPQFKLYVDDFTKDTLRELWNFIGNEYRYYELYPEIYEKFPEAKPPCPRSKNTLIDYFNRIRTFFNWCYENGHTTNKPFEQFPVEESLYGTPVYITLQERDLLMNYDFKTRNKLAIQRDIFIFQCYIGCRVSDLYRFTKSNIVGECLEYIPRKTKDGNPKTVRVPLHENAKKILQRYSGKSEKLFPFISSQKYNDAIKDMFKLAGLDRMVTVLDPLTREEVRKPLYAVASSHMARRTFIGNIYKQVKDPNLVSALSGHKEGSRAFNRYRDIDDEIKQELINLL